MGATALILILSDFDSLSKFSKISFFSRCLAEGVLQAVTVGFLVSIAFYASDLVRWCLSIAKLAEEIKMTTICEQVLGEGEELWKRVPSFVLCSVAVCSCQPSAMGVVA